ncbi:MAG: hypothetical protein AB1546_05350 [bacterium]
MTTKENPRDELEKDDNTLKIADTEQAPKKTIAEFEDEFNASEIELQNIYGKQVENWSQCVELSGGRYALINPRRVIKDESDHRTITRYELLDNHYSPKNGFTISGSADLLSHQEFRNSKLGQTIPESEYKSLEQSIEKWKEALFNAKRLFEKQTTERERAWDALLNAQNGKTTAEEIQNLRQRYVREEEIFKDAEKNYANIKAQHDGDASIHQFFSDIDAGNYGKDAQQIMKRLNEITIKDNIFNEQREGEELKKIESVEQAIASLETAADVKVYLAQLGIKSIKIDQWQQVPPALKEMGAWNDHFYGPGMKIELPPYGSLEEAHAAQVSLQTALKGMEKQLDKAGDFARRTVMRAFRLQIILAEWCKWHHAPDADRKSNYFSIDELACPSAE